MYLGNDAQSLPALGTPQAIRHQHLGPTTRRKVFDVARHQCQFVPFRHGSLWRLTFTEPIEGQLGLGFGYDYGLGLFQPVETLK